MHHRPPRERTSPFGHYLRCTPSTVPCTPIHWATVTPSVLALPYYSYTPYYTLFIIRYMYIFFHLTLPFPTTLFIPFTLYISILSLFSLSLPLYYLYLYFSYFTLFLYSYSLLFLSLFISTYTTLSTLAETI